MVKRTSPLSRLGRSNSPSEESMDLQWPDESRLYINRAGTQNGETTPNSSSKAEP